MTTRALLDEARTQGAQFQLGGRFVAAATGADAVRYLHNRLTQNIRQLTAGKGVTALVLSPQGRVQMLLRVLHTAPQLLLYSEPLGSSASGDAVIRDLLQFKVADDVQLEDMSASHSVRTVVGAAANEIPKLLGLELVLPDVSEAVSCVSFVLDATPVVAAGILWGALPRLDFIFPNSVQASFDVLFERAGGALLRSGDAELYEALRVFEGLPGMGYEITEKTIGSDLPIERYVAFNKGCYTGQEVIEMATARGRPNRALVPLLAQSVTPVAAAAQIRSNDEARSVVGTVTSAVRVTDAEETLLLGYIKTGTPPDVELTVDGLPVTRRIHSAP